ncbi:hypothetical protein IAT38_003120 [Cryptococcus sp. DSM 104549]
MPGSKRRALKKLLSPNNSSPSGSPASSNPIPVPASSTVDPTSGTAPTSGISPPVDLPPAVANAGISPEEVQEDLVLEEMAEREKVIGHQGASPAQAHALAQGSPASDASGASGGMYGGGMYGHGRGGGRGGKKKSSRQKFEERQARKQEALANSAPPEDPQWTAQLEKERQDEIRIIGAACVALGREIHEIAPDGHCMYAAIGDQLGLIGIISKHDAADPKVIRKHAANFMLSHPDDFMPFLPSITGEDSAGATDDGLMTEEGFKKYCSLVADTGEWGGEPEIQALSRAFSIPIHVIQRGPPTIVSHGHSNESFGGVLTPEESKEAGDRVVRISYHKRMYGLGEHYNSLRVA